MDEALVMRTKFVPSRRDVRISWGSANEPWTVLNTDGSAILSDNKAAAGGVIRDAQGRMKVALAANLGTCTITCVKMSEVIDVMERAWSLGVSYLEV
ncbi:hypothetical protein LINGRAHAP2_LOCUS34550 [Linum grandiflorum]